MECRLETKAVGKERAIHCEIIAPYGGMFWHKWEVLQLSFLTKRLKDFLFTPDLYPITCSEFHMYTFHYRRNRCRVLFLAGQLV
jgi:hypothetical protein